MANRKITECTELTTAPAADDVIAIVDISDTTDAASGTTKKQQWLNAIKWLFGSRFAEDAGANDTYTATLVPAPTAYITGEHYRFKANTANTGACTVNFNGLGAKAIKKAAGGITTDLADNDIRAGQWVDLVYDGTNMQMQSLLGNAPTGGAEAGANSDITSMDGLTGVLETVTRIDFAEGAAPGTPGAGEVSLYAKADGLLYSKDDAGLETVVTGGGGGGSIAPLVIEDANTVAQRNSTNNQNFQVHGVFNSATDYTRIRIGFTAGAAQVFSEAQTQGASSLVFKVGSGTTLTLSTSDLIPGTNIVFNLGDATHYFNEVYSNVWVTRSGGQLRFVSGARMSGPAQGIINWTDDSGNSGSGTIRFDNRTPAQITSDQNNYSIPVTGYHIRLSTDASRTLTGLTFGGGGKGDGQIHLLVNVGSNDLVLAHQSASSTDSNRFLCSTGANITLGANQAADLIYDAIVERWRVFKRN